MSFLLMMPWCDVRTIYVLTKFMQCIQTYEYQIWHKICINLWSLVSLWCLKSGQFLKLSPYNFEKWPCEYHNLKILFDFWNYFLWLQSCNHKNYMRIYDVSRILLYVYNDQNRMWKYIFKKLVQDFFPYQMCTKFFQFFCEL